MHTLALTLLVLLQGADSPNPANWPVTVRDSLLRQGERWSEPKALVTGQRGLIGGTSGPSAIRVGRNILASGGSAADAVVATSLCQIVLSGGSWNSFAGITMGMYFEEKTKRVYALNAAYNTVMGEKEPLTIPAQTPSGRTALVPGYFAGICDLQKRFGKLPRAKVFEPAVSLAREGFPTDAVLEYMINLRKEWICRLPETKAIFCGPSGDLLKKGETFRQSALADTLESVAKIGPSYIYTGHWAKRFVDAVNKEGGKMSLKDLADYRSTISEPIRAKFKGYEICAMPPPSFGGVDIIEAMNAVEIAGIDKRPTESAESLWRLMMISRFSWLQNYARPKLDANAKSDPFAPSNRIKKENARKLVDRMSDKGWQVKLFKDAGEKPPMHSDCLVAIDAEGNVAVLLHSINTVLWGKTGLFVDGVSIPDSACFQQSVIAKIKPGSRLPDPTNPLIVLRDGRPFLACGTIGAALNESMLQNLVNILLFDMDAKTSVESPMFWGAGYGNLGDYYKQAVSKGVFSKALLDELAKLGQQVVEIDPAKETLRVSQWIGARLDANGAYSGCLPRDTSGLFEGF